MPNQFLTLNRIARRSLANLVNNLVFASLVFRDYDEDFNGAQGDTITVRTPAVLQAMEFDRDEGIVLQAVEEGSFPVTLDTILDVSVEVPSEQMLLDIADFDEQVGVPAARALAEKVDGFLADQVIADAHWSVTGSDAKVLTRARAPLGRSNIPLSERYAVWSPEAAAKLMEDPLLTNAEKRGNTDGLIEAAIGRKFGFDNYETAGVASPLGAAFHRSMVALATATLPKPRGGVEAAVASYGGLGIRVTYGYDQDKKKEIMSWDLLCGLKTLRPKAGVKVELEGVEEFGS